MTCCSSSRGGSSASSRARSNGSGSQPHADHQRRGQHPDAAERERPGQLGDAELVRRPRPRARSGWGRATAPIVVAQTTVDSARARRSAGARSVAAYRAPLLAAVVEPSSDGADQQQRHRVRRPRRRPPAPRRRRRAGSRSSGRPAGRASDISRASRNDATAAPSTWKVCASPACDSEPEMSRASREAVAIPMVIPTAPTACATTSVPMVRRWTATGVGSGVRHRSHRGQLEGRPDRAPHLLRRHAGVERLRGRCGRRARAMTYWSAQARAYADPSAASIRSQNSVCLIGASRARRASHRPERLVVRSTSTTSQPASVEHRAQRPPRART